MQEPVEVPNYSELSNTFKYDACDYNATLEVLRNSHESLIGQREHPVLGPHIINILNLYVKLTNHVELTPADFLGLHNEINSLATTIESSGEEDKPWLVWLWNVNRDLESGLSSNLRTKLRFMAEDVKAFKTHMDNQNTEKAAEIKGQIVANAKVDGGILHQWLSLEKTRSSQPEGSYVDFNYFREHSGFAPTIVPQPSHNLLLKIIATAKQRPWAVAALVIGIAAVVIGGLALGGVPIAGVVVGLLTAKIVTGLGAGFVLGGALGLFAPGRKKEPEPAGAQPQLREVTI